MRYSKYPNYMLPRQRAQAALLIDHDNLHATLAPQLKAGTTPDALVGEILTALRRFMAEEHRADTTLANAYAAYGGPDGPAHTAIESLQQRGIDARLVSPSEGPHACQEQLCVEAMEVMLQRPDLSMLVILSGNQFYLPLVRFARRQGLDVFIATVEAAPAGLLVPYVDSDALIDALGLLSDESRTVITSEDQDTHHTAVRREWREDVEHLEVTDTAGLRALEIIEDNFGQYEEVYLTPLLRKLSEALEPDGFDPKTVINGLEEAGAVWLEKRRGFPYDYTVLLTDTEHPQVQQIRTLAQERRESEGDYDYEDDYRGDDYDDYDDDYYDETSDQYDEDKEDREDSTVNGRQPSTELLPSTSAT